MATTACETFVCVFLRYPPPQTVDCMNQKIKIILPLQADKLGKKMHNRLTFTITSTCHEQVGPAQKMRMREKRHGVGFETVAGIGGLS